MMLLPFPTGIEIETGTGYVSRNLIPQSWEAGIDGSCGLEFKSGKIEKESALFQEVPQICRLLQDTVGVHNRCGLHVHMGFKQIKDLSAKYRLFRFMSHYEETFFKLLSPHPARVHFCTRLPQTLWQDMQKGLGFECWKSIDSRYWWFNGKAMHVHGTVEFRLMNGTLNSKEILGWASLLQCIFDAVVNKEVKIPWERATTIDFQKFLSDAKVDTNTVLGAEAAEFVNNNT